LPTGTITQAITAVGMIDDDAAGSSGD